MTDEDYDIPTTMYPEVPIEDNIDVSELHLLQKPIFWTCLVIVLIVIYLVFWCKKKQAAKQRSSSESAETAEVPQVVVDKQELDPLTALEDVNNNNEDQKDEFQDAKSGAASPDVTNEAKENTE